MSRVFRRGGHRDPGKGWDTQTNGPAGGCPIQSMVQEAGRVTRSKRGKTLNALQGFRRFSPWVMGNHGGLGSQVSNMTNKEHGEYKLIRGHQGPPRLECLWVKSQPRPGVEVKMPCPSDAKIQGHLLLALLN